MRKTILCTNKQQQNLVQIALHNVEWSRELDLNPRKPKSILSDCPLRTLPQVDVLHMIHICLFCLLVRQNSIYHWPLTIHLVASPHSIWSAIGRFPLLLKNITV